ncbi:hypothetical protein [Hymenobacter lapidiphilus]|uniref:Uncharacterized protein n=1 Tax=Hymenobacter lapidiphilus TaxID=2608003 RepID=A0A7Y7PKS3_9BACT|nr:hypothetical protein [Hymenobacter lapidiphilus]NVO29674.1 hypothetical protein [Hymenobacter lapidiphilus]
MSRIIGSLIITFALFRDAFRHDKPLSYLLLLGSLLFFALIIDVLRAIFSRSK